MNYHAHVYYRSKTSAAKTRHHLQEKVSSNFRLFPFHTGPIGPHPLPSFGLAFEATHLDFIQRWMHDNVGWMTGLIHPVLADDLYAHTVHAEWIGGEVNLKKEALSRPPTQLGNHRLRPVENSTLTLDLDQFEIYENETLIGNCTLGAYYHRGCSVLNTCILRDLNLLGGLGLQSAKLLLNYLKAYTDCQEIRISDGIDWPFPFENNILWSHENQ